MGNVILLAAAQAEANDLFYVRIHGDFYGTIYDKFTELTGDDITFTDDEKKKLLYLLN
ncbi:hypothetical protein [Paenibacillus alvei]|uniref:Uncharacterized protein n=1 Tax=Paenibacillus alvei TaxID=44250 RepID=A0A383R7K1_PAEAL|nr:hypothetical protein [Paenibacillus alvei]SYX83127.1 protein of unknown function [Paenibacillus alvei]